MTVISTDNAEHYIWGDGCDGWHLVKTSTLSVIKERIMSEPNNFSLCLKV